jgi:hypothetical protein
MLLSLILLLAVLVQVLAKGRGLHMTEGLNSESRTAQV